MMHRPTRSQAVARIADQYCLTAPSGVTWRHRSRDYLIAHMPFPIGGPLEFGTPLNPAVFEILRSNRIVVTSLTFQGHVTSSVMWPFDSPYANFYWWSFWTMPLSLTVSEIFNVESNAMVDMTLIRPINEGQGHSFWYQSISHIRLRRLSIVTFERPWPLFR